MVSRRKVFRLLLGAPLAIVGLAPTPKPEEAVSPRTLIVKFKADTASFDEAILKAIENAKRLGRIA